jgi:hypothetical protein
VCLQSNFGAVSLDYALSDQPTFGEWTIRVTAQGQTEEEHFHVEEYYQTRFEVNVTMPAFYFDTDDFIHGTVMANYTSGAPVRGNLTLKATFKPIRATPLILDKPGPIRDSLIERNLTFKEVRGGWFTPHTREGSEVLKDVRRVSFVYFLFLYISIFILFTFFFFFSLEVFIRSNTRWMNCGEWCLNWTELSFELRPSWAIATVKTMSKDSQRPAYTIRR